MPSPRELVGEFAEKPDFIEFWDRPIPQDTAERIVKIVREDKAKFGSQASELAYSIFTQYHVEQRKRLKKIMALYEWIITFAGPDGYVRHFQNDIDGVEKVSHFPQILYTMKHYGVIGDCDDHCVLMGVLAKAAGIPAVLILAGRSPQGFSHVYLKLESRPATPKLSGEWISFDPTPRIDGSHQALGWEFPWDHPYYKEYLL